MESRVADDVSLKQWCQPVIFPHPGSSVNDSHITAHPLILPTVYAHCLNSKDISFGKKKRSRYIFSPMKGSVKTRIQNYIIHLYRKSADPVFSNVSLPQKTGLHFSIVPVPSVIENTEAVTFQRSKQIIRNRIIVLGKIDC